MHRRSPNCLYLDDEVMVQLPWGSTPFLCRVAGFNENDEIRVEAVERSDDPFVENDFVVTYSDIV